MDNPIKTSQTRSRPLPSNEELLSQIRLLLDSPEDDLQAAIMKELLAGTLDFPGIARLMEQAVARYGSGTDQAPGVDELVDLDREVRGMFAAPGRGGGTAGGPAA